LLLQIRKPVQEPRIKRQYTKFFYIDSLFLKRYIQSPCQPNKDYTKKQSSIQYTKDTILHPGRSNNTLCNTLLHLYN